jgi:predicted GNAT family acetyltransferase
MDILREENHNKGMFYVGDAGAPLAGMYYHMASPQKMIIDHTEVSDELRGKNVGYQLVKASVDYARANNIKIVPVCPFAKSVFQKKEDLRDVLV